MSNFLRNRWLHRALFVGVLIALGVGIYHFESPEPMCEMDAGNLAPHCFVDGGRRFVTLPTSDLPGASFGPLQIWDCSSGREVGRHFENGQILHGSVFSKNSRCFACSTMREMDDKNRASVLHVIDLAADTALDVPLDDSNGELSFTPAGDVLTLLVPCKEGKELQIYDSATGGLLWKHASKQLVLKGLIDQAVLYSTRSPPAGWDLEIWSVPERRSLGTIPNAGSPVSSPDGRFLLFERLQADGSSARKWAVWSMKDLRVEGEFEARRSDEISPMISADSRWSAMMVSDAQGDSALELREFPSGRLGARLRVDMGGARFSPDGRWLAAPDPNVPDRILVLETPTLNMRWSFAERVREWEYSADSRTAFVLTTDETGFLAIEIVACESETGAVRDRFPLASIKNPLIRMTPDRRNLLVRQGADFRRGGWLDRIPWVSRLLPASTDCVIVIDTNSARERFRLIDSDAQSALLSDDGNRLATQHEGGIIRCWDVNACKPLPWPIGVPAGVGVLALAAGWWRRAKLAAATSS